MVVTISTTARLERVRLPWQLDPADVLAALESEPLPFALVGAWSGGGAIIGSDPIRIADESEDPFALLDELPEVDGALGTAGAVGGGWFGWLGYRLATHVENVPLVAERPVELPDFHLAYYDNVLRLDAAGVWWVGAVGPQERR